MNVMFGLALDGYRQLMVDATLGVVTVGPQGLLDLLETHLGLAGVATAQPVRIARYQRCLQETDNGRRFYSSSLAVDPLAVSETLLQWHDEWISAGWDGIAGESDGPRVPGCVLSFAA